tara:strand:- start:36 stop:458 length:423 start_codon:yes stop_codon:yes gene_type:complete
MLAARAPGLQGETIVVVYDAGRGIFSSFVGLFFASEMFPIIFNFFFCIFLSPLFREICFKRQRKNKKRALLLLCAKEDKEEEDKEEGRPPKGRLFLSLSHAKGYWGALNNSFVQKWIDRSTRRSPFFSFSFSFSFYIIKM